MEWLLFKNRKNEKMKELVGIFAMFFSISTFSQVKEPYFQNQNIETKIALNNDLEVLVFNEGNKIWLNCNGFLKVDYHDSGFTDKELKGKIKQIGNYKIEYYSTFDDKTLRGKVKSIGDFKFSYYDVFDAEILREKIKTIDDVKFEYYDQFSSEGDKGKLKKISGGNNKQINNIFGLNF